MAQTLDSDRAVASKESDEFGFIGIAESLAPRIVQASQGDGLVIGLEGAWGSGKSSLMQLIRAEIDELKENNVHTITVAPWLNGDSSALVLSLLVPIAQILDKEIESSAVEEIKSGAEKIGKLVASYGERTARRVAPIVKLAGLLVPGVEMAGKAVGSLGDVLEQFNGAEPTVSELKEIISEQLKLIDHTFVVFLDDLDRLEPAQAVEVVRLMRSVADFPKVVYLICYDREVLANGLENGLNVENGDLFLQKIVQLTFKIPQFEPFELRNQFLRMAQSIFEEVNETPLHGEPLAKLRRVVDVYGQGLTTPREVKLTLNAVQFLYPSVFSDVYFSDFCMLHMLKTTRYKLYRWLEEYLSTRSVLVSGEASVSKEDRIDSGKRLSELLPSKGHSSPDSVFVLQDYIPGISKNEKPEERVFGVVHQDEEQEKVLNKRLGSPVHYRFYFALTGPKSIMSDQELADVLLCAKNDHQFLVQRLTDYANTTGALEMERLLFRLESELSSSTDPNILEGLVLGFGDVMDRILENQKEPGFLKTTSDQRIDLLVENCLRWIGEVDKSKKLKISLHMAREGTALSWLVGKFFRGQLFSHGRVGTSAKHIDERIFTDDELDRVIDVLKHRVAAEDTLDQVGGLPGVHNYLFGWENVTGSDKDVLKWVISYTSDTSGFLNLLNSLRHRVMSDKLYRPISRESVSKFLDWDDTTLRLSQLRGGEHDSLVKDLEEAMAMGEDH